MASGEKQPPMENMYRLMKEKCRGWQENAATAGRGQTTDHFSFPPFLTVQLKLLTKTHPDCQSGNGWCVCFFLFYHNSFSGTNDSAGSPQTLEWNRHCPNIPPDSLPLLFTHSEQHFSSYPLSVSTAHLSDLAAQFTSDCLKLKISAAFVCQCLSSFLTLMTRLVINRW